MNRISNILLTSTEVPINAPKRAEPPVSSGVLGILIFIVTESMFFAALVSSFIVIKSGLETWPPWGQPRLPIEITALNTVVLILSGLIMWQSRKLFLKGKDQSGRKWYGISLLLGTLFLLIQGNEWIQLISFGLTLSSSVYGGLFYLIIGAHAFHVAATLVILAIAWRRLGVEDDSLTPEQVFPLQILWYFVVGVWPILYLLVYLN